MINTEGVKEKLWMSSKSCQSASAELISPVKRKYGVRLSQNVVELDQAPGVWWGQKCLK